MEQQFFHSISDEEQEKTAKAIDKMKDDIGHGKTRDDIKSSYARRLTERLAKVKA